MPRYTILSAAVLTTLAGVAQADVVSWNYDRYGTVTGADHFAGVVSVANWNNTWPDNPVTDLIDDTGTATTLDITYSSFNSWTVNEPTPANPGPDSDGTYNRELLNGYLNAGYAPWGPPITYSEVALSDIPYGQYDIIVYFSSDVAGRAGDITDGTTTYSFNTVGPASVSGADAVLAQTTDTAGTYATTANYAVFSGLLGHTQTIQVQMRDEDQWAGIAGFQIVKTADACGNDYNGDLSADFFDLLDYLGVYDEGGCDAPTGNPNPGDILSLIDFEDQTVGSNIDFVDEHGNFWFGYAATTAELPVGSADVPGSTDRRANAPATTVSGDFSPGFGYLEVEGDAFELAGGDWTIETFIKFADTGGYQTILGRDRDLLDLRGAGADLYFQKMSDNHFRCDYRIGWIDNGDGTYTEVRTGAVSQTVAAPGQWYHVAAVYDATARTLSLYINSKLESQVTDVDNIMAVTDPFSQFYSVGRGFWDGNPVDNLNAVIDDLRVTAAALTPNEFLGLPDCPSDVDGDGDADADDVLQIIGDVDAGCP
ncbi:MAG: LamG domain-containing protein [Phycisphaeraceae bacterium]|nr:MAG: LamG domain-containing protein [Phycisphaeraceae bacterium]